MGKKRAKALAITLAGVSLDARDGPTPEYLNHYKVIVRTAINAAVGKRKRGLAERLMDNNRITPAQSDAIRRFGGTRERMCGGSSSPLAGTGGSKGRGCDYEFPQWKITNTRAYVAASDAIGPEAEQVIVWVHEDKSLRYIQRQLNLGCHKTAESRVREHAGKLALYYEEIDEARGRSTTPFTKEAAIRSVDPDDPEP